jgi:outer membrane protein assembly factor BamB
MACSRQLVSDFEDVDVLRRSAVFTVVIVVATCGRSIVHAGNDSVSPPVAMWQRAGGGVGAPVSDTGHVYFLSNRHTVIAVDAASGHVQWTCVLGSDAGWTDGSRLVVKGSLLVTGDSDLFGIDVDTGRIRWRFSAGDERARIGAFLGGAGDDAVFAGAADGRLFAIAAETGAIQWMAAVGGADTKVFAPAADRTLVTARFTTYGKRDTGGVIAVDARTGRERWRAAIDPAAAPPAGGPLLFGRFVIVASRSGHILAFDRSTGARRWSIPPTRLRNTDRAPQKTDFRALARTGSTLFAGSITGVLTAYDLDSLKELWSFADPSGGSIRFQIDSDEQYVYVPFLSGRLSAVDILTGQERWRVGTRKSGFGWPPAVSRNAIFLAGYDGLFAFRRP